MKLAVLGTGKIAHDALFAMQPLIQIERNAIFARPHSRDKGEAMAAEYGIREVYTDYDELLARADIDTIYIGLANHVHYEYAMKALQHGKHVIMEKPFTGTAEEAEALHQAALANDVFVLEAITVLHCPVFEQMKKNLPKLGKVRMLLGNYSQYSSRYDRYLSGIVDHTFDPACLGGALRDINVYNVHYAVGLFGQPKHAAYYGNIGFNGVDTSGTLVMEYDGFSAVCTGAKDSDSVSYLSVQGEKGWMRIDGKPNVAANLTTVWVDENNPELVKDAAGGMVRATLNETFVPETPHHRMTQEFADFARIVDEHDAAAAEILMSESVAVMRVIEGL